jgi:hypothetical protein
MNLRAPLDPEMSLARLLRGAFLELEEAERLLITLETVTPTPEHEAQLAIVRDAVRGLAKVVLLPSN